MKNIIKLLPMVLFLSACGQPQSKDTGTVEIKKSALIASTKKLWNNNQTINVSFLDGTPEQKAEVEEYSAEWLKYANLNFKFYPTLKDVPWRKSVDIVISFHGVGSNSAVGTDSKNFSTQGYSMSLSTPSKYAHVNKYYILHEFGHAIGLNHEHQHIDRNFDLDEAETFRYCTVESKLSPEACRMYMIATITDKDTYFSKYDPKSIMHYGFHSALFKTNKVEIPASQVLSLIDKLEIANLYPGRTTKEKIIAEHQESIQLASAIQDYRNCKITESTIEQMRLNEQGKPELMAIARYSFASIIPGDYNYDYLSEDKQTIITAMKKSDYCNYDAPSLGAYRNNLANNRLQDTAFGNCHISLDDSGDANPRFCTGEFPFEIQKNGKTELAVNLCFPKFEAAVLNMKSDKYCSTNPAELAELERKKIAELEKSFSFGKCKVKDNALLTNPREKARCRLDTPWFISSVKTLENMGMCYSNVNSAITDMKNLKACEL